MVTRIMIEDPPLARRDLIASRLARGQSVVAAALAAEFTVSEDAIRRDLRALAAAGQCRRVYGGALPILTGSTPMAARIGEGRGRKEALARTAVAMIKPGEFIFLDSGSTNLALADILPDDYELTVATNSIDIAAAVLRRSDLRLIMVGGAVNNAVGGCVDSSAVQSLARMNIDRSFVGACSISPETGLSTFENSDAIFKRALLAASRHSLALATSDKFAIRAPHRIAAIDEIGWLVVEHDAPAQTLEELLRIGASILKAEYPA